MRNASGYRDFPGKGVLINGLRILHLAGVVAVGGTLLAEPAREPGSAALVLLVAPGALIAMLDAWSKPGYAFQLKGLGVIAKLLLVAWMALDADHRLMLFWVILAFSSAAAHAPGRVRGYSPWRSRR
ncbi:MAG: hypothetical protein Fur0039_00140 [Rhodocyclaceae bacterium]